MPQIVQDPGIIAAARQAIEVYLHFKGIEVTLVPIKGNSIAKPGGGRDYIPPTPRAPQTFALVKTNAFDGLEFSPNDDGLSRKRAYLLTGRHDAAIAIGDNWSDYEADYTVDTLDQTSGYKSIATVTGFLKV